MVVWRCSAVITGRGDVGACKKGGNRGFGVDWRVENGEEWSGEELEDGVEESCKRMRRRFRGGEAGGDRWTWWARERKTREGENKCIMKGTYVAARPRSGARRCSPRC